MEWGAALDVGDQALMECDIAEVEMVEAII
jgi:hypothetical protein